MNTAINTSESGVKTLEEAGNQFLGTLSEKGRKEAQQDVSNFVRWYGGAHVVSQFTAPEIAHYAEHLSASDTDYARKLAVIRQFLQYAHKQGWSTSNMGTHLKATRKLRSGGTAPAPNGPNTVFLTKDGYDKLKVEIAELKKRRAELTEDIRKAAADKDFRENAPLHAAREQKGYLEGKIKQCETTLKSAAVIQDDKKGTSQARVGDTVLLCDLKTGEDVSYTIVSTREADPAKGRISNTSPLGKATLGHAEEDQIEIVVPAGRMSYRIKRIQR